MSLDYVRFKILNPDTSKLLRSKSLDFKGEYSESTGEIFQNKLIAEFHFCKVEVYKSGSVYFSGSIHKLYNSLHNILAPNYNKTRHYKGYNGNQFNLSNIIEIRNYLSQLLHCKPKQMLFKNIEVGFNLPLPFNPQKFLTGLLYHNGTQFEHSRNKRLWVAYKNDYRIKIYNKGEQYKLNCHTLRYEIHYDRMKAIKTFGDINRNTLSKAHELTIKEYCKIVYYDNTIRKKELSKPQQKAIKNYSNVRYWMEILKPTKRDKPKKKLNEIILNHSDNLKQIILQEISKTGVIITQQYIPKKNKTGVIITYSIKGVNITPTVQRICPVTGVNISMQKDSSKLLSNTGLRWLFSNNKKEFNKWVDILLTGNYNKYEKDIFSKLSKQIRNRYYNNYDLYNSNQLKIW